MPLSSTASRAVAELCRPQTLQSNYTQQILVFRPGLSTGAGLGNKFSPAYPPKSTSELSLGVEIASPHRTGNGAISIQAYLCTQAEAPGRCRSWQCLQRTISASCAAAPLSRAHMWGQECTPSPADLLLSSWHTLDYHMASLSTPEFMNTATLPVALL